MSDWQREKTEQANFLRECCPNGRTISVYKRRETIRPYRILEDDTIEVLCGRVWRRAFVDPGMLRKVIVGWN